MLDRQRQRHAAADRPGMCAAGAIRRTPVNADWALQAGANSAANSADFRRRERPAEPVNRKRSTNPVPCAALAVVMDVPNARRQIHAAGSTIRQGSRAS